MATHERSIFGLTVCKNSHPDIRKIRRETGDPSIHGNKFWKSSILLMDYLQEYPLRKRARVLEVGCGWGLAGIFCAKHFNARLTSLDADSSVFPYLEYHAELNGIGVNTWRCRYEKIRMADLEQFDVIIGADICFWDQMSDMLYNLISRARRAGVSRVVMTDPGRPPFRTMAERLMHKQGAEYFDWHSAHPHNASGILVNLSFS